MQPGLLISPAATVSGCKLQNPFPSPQAKRSLLPRHGIWDESSRRMQQYVNRASIFAEFAREPHGEFTARLVCK
jgi:hypothetical protein